MSRRRILVVEDEFIVAYEMKAELEDMGFEVCGLVSSGEAAVETAVTERPDVVLMDVNISGHKGGIDAAREIRSRLGTPIAFISGLPRTQVREWARDVRPVGVFAKPIDYDEVQRTLQDELVAAPAVDRRFSD